MMDEYFGHKELYAVVLRAKTPMQFGSRYIEADEPVLYFDNVNMSLLTEQSRPVFARGGWGNMPRVIWDERSEVQFQMVEGVMSSVGMSILLSANVLSEKDKQPLYINIKEEFSEPSTHKVEINGEEQNVPYVDLKHQPVFYPEKKMFVFEFARKAPQQKIYCKYLDNVIDGYNNKVERLELYQDKNCTIPAENSRNYLVDYYYKYEDEAFMDDSPMTFRSQLKDWALEMLMAWHRLDPVSEKERNRNEGIYRNWQGNRNPFIDFPELADLIWGEGSEVFTMEPDTLIRPRVTRCEVVDETTVAVGFDSVMSPASTLWISFKPVIGKLAGPMYLAPMSSAIVLRVVFLIFIGKQF